MFHRFSRTFLSILFLSLTATSTSQAFITQDSLQPKGRLFAAKSDFITGCGMDSKDLSQDPNYVTYVTYVNQAIQRLLNQVQSECSTEAQRITQYEIQGICVPNYYFYGYSQITASAKFLCRSLQASVSGLEDGTEIMQRECRKICEIDPSPGNACGGTHGVCLKCRYECS